MSLGQENRGPAAAGPHGQPQTVVVQQPARHYGRARVWLLTLLLGCSLAANYLMYSRYQDYFATDEGPTERYHSGDRTAPDKIALIRVSGTIMPPFTSHVVK